MIVLSLFYVAYLLLGAGALYVTWRLTSRCKNIPMRLSLWSFVFAVFFSSARLGITYIPFPRTIALILDYLDSKHNQGASFDPLAPERLLEFYFIPAAITWLVVFLAAWLCVLWFGMRKSDQLASLDKDRGE